MYAELLMRGVNWLKDTSKINIYKGIWLIQGKGLLVGVMQIQNPIAAKASHGQCL